MLLSEIRSIRSEHSTHLSSIKEKLKPFISKRLKKTEGKAVNDVIRQMYHLFALHDIDVTEFIKDFDANRIFDASVLLTGGDLFSKVTEEYRDLATELYNVRSAGLGTPNAASGEGELMALMLSPDVSVSKKQNAGDLIVQGKYVELKGWAPRVFGNVSGTALNILGQKLCVKYGITPNSATKKRIAVEPWDTGKKNTHWKEQFQILGKNKAIQFLIELMNGTGATFSESSMARCFSGNIFSPAQLQKEIIKALFAANEKKWDFLTVIVDGKVEAVSNSNTDFEKAVDTGKIIPSGNFFRMFQPSTVGWYYRFAIAPDTIPNEEGGS
jgi:hypothetical protein